MNHPITFHHVFLLYTLLSPFTYPYNRFPLSPFYPSPFIVYLSVAHLLTISLVLTLLEGPRPPKAEGPEGRPPEEGPRGCYIPQPKSHTL